MSINSVTVSGNLTRDPELRFTTGGRAVCSLSVAHNRRRKDSAGNWEDAEPSFFDVECWAALAESVAESLSKGDGVTVSGRLEQQRWEQNGDKRSKVLIVAEEVASRLRVTSHASAGHATYAPGEEAF